MKELALIEWGIDKTIFLWYTSHKRMYWSVGGNYFLTGRFGSGETYPKNNSNLF